MSDQRYDSSARPAEEGPSDPDLEELRRRVLYFAARRLRSWAEAEDVAQEAIGRALEAIRNGRLEQPKSLPAFVFQTAIHVCQHRSRSAGREGRALRRAVASQSKDDDDPLGSLISTEERAAVRDALARLNDDDREILSLTYAEALRTPDIARRLGLSEGNVRVRRHRALRRLAELLGVTPNSHREP